MPAHSNVSDRPPLAYWALPAVVSLLRGLPYLRAVRMTPLAEGEIANIGYNPQDWLAYLGMIRQVVDRGAFFFENPFTLEPQSGRFILLFHWLIGAVSAVLDVRPEVVLELSRVPLLFGFFGVLWWFLRPFCESRVERLWAAALVGLGGGVDAHVRPFLGALPSGLEELVRTSTWQLYGWSSFGSFYNPLWIAALIVLLLLLRPVLSTCEYRPGQILRLGLGLALLWSIHSYTALAFIAISLFHCATRAVLSRDPGRLLGLAKVGGVFLVVTAPLIVWQRMDPVFQKASSGFLGDQLLSMLWYPLTFGAVLVLAVVGLRLQLRERRSHRVALLGWIVAVAVLHNSSIWNGYHFVMYQHIPISMLAATAVAAILSDGGSNRLRSAVVLALTALALSAPLFLTADAVAAVERRQPLPAGSFELMEHLRERPAGHVLASTVLGNYVPGYTGHKVFAGQWFLTPSNPEKAHLYDRLVSDPRSIGELDSLLAEQRIDYLIVPAGSDRVLEALGERVRETRPFGVLVLAVLENEPASRSNRDPE